jgi:diguanylate cyclase (GGDEF)-like protein/PAS domain S-box-containing protein
MESADPQFKIDYRAIVENVPAIAFVAGVGEFATWHYVNEWIEPILGFTAQEWLGDPMIWSRQLHPDDRATTIAAEALEARAARGQALPAGSEQAAPLYLDYRMLHKDGHIVWIRDSSVLVPDASGELLWHGVLLDISDRKQIEAELARQSAAQAAVAQLGEHALERRPVQELLAEACEAAARVLEVEVALVVQARDDEDTLDVRASMTTLTYELPVMHQVGIDPNTQFAVALRTGRPVAVDDWEQERELNMSSGQAAIKARSSVMNRIEGPERPWGCFVVSSTSARHYSPSDISFIQSLVNILADAIERLDAEDAIEHRSLHDSLTGLPNRTLFADRLEQAFERLRRHPNAHASILFIDIDHFKQINDTLGHQAGDELLMAVAQRLHEAVRPTDTVARRSGDEFVVLLDEIGSERDAITAAERIAASFSRPFVLGATTQFVTASLGIALADGYMSPSELLENADAAMYRAKERGRARYELFDEGMRVRAVARMRLESDLARALDQRELRLVYQPVVELSTESISGVEALLRWDHPQRGTIPPGEFIQVAEDCGLIDRIGYWVIEEALRAVGRWHRQRPDAAPLLIGINVATPQLLDPHFAEMLSEQITAFGVAASSVCLEFSERVLLNDAAPVRRALRALYDLGVALVLDDFGTGESSLTHLANLPLRTLKIDRTFVSRLGTDGADHQVVRALVAVGQALSLRVVGKGAETTEQVGELRRLGCVAAQGYVFSPPVPEHEITAMLQSGARLAPTLG